MSYDAFANAIPTMTYDEQINLLSMLIDAVKKGIHSNSEKTTEVKDHRSSYPEGYFDLFGSDPTFFEESEELPWEVFENASALTFGILCIRI